jgi:hypothetical protein
LFHFLFFAAKIATFSQASPFWPLKYVN